jgi:hypothetical protein
MIQLTRIRQKKICGSMEICKERWKVMLKANLMNGLLIATTQPTARGMGWLSPRPLCRAAIVAIICTAALAVWPAQRAYAADNVYTHNIPLTETDFTEMITLPKFDLQLGALERVEISFSSNLQGSVQFESLDSSPALVTTEMQGWLHLQGPDGAFLTSTNPTTTRSIELRSFDGLLDFGGISGGAFNQMVAIGLSDTKMLLAPAELALFSGPGSVQLTMAAQGQVAGSGGGNLALNYTTEASALVTLKYVYRTTVNPAIDLEKYTNGEDADLPTGPLIEKGKSVIWTYVVHNTGDTPLVNVQLRDDKEGSITCLLTALAVNEQMTCTAEGIATLGQYANTATVTGDTPHDPLAPTQTVSDTDPSHYYGVPLSTLCPPDPNGMLVLPQVTYLGEGGGPYTLPGDFEIFVVKRLAPFHFVVEPGVDRGGQKIYTPLNTTERVYACAGACQFPQALRTLYNIGPLGPGITIGAVVLDDDNDARINAWVANGDTNNPYQTINLQTMVEYLVLDVPFDADWSFNAVDSVGLLHICLALTTNVRAASIWGEGEAAAQAEELNEIAFTFRILLPITTN